MLKSIFTRKQHESVHDMILFFLFCLMGIALPTSRNFVSVVQILMGVNWLAEGHYKEKILRYQHNRPAVTLSLIYAVFILGLLWTKDLTYGIDYDLKNKLPIFTLTFVLASSRPFSKQRWNMAALAFSLSVLVTSIIGFIIFLSRDYINPRSVSPFESHVYFSMMVVMTIYLLPWLAKQMKSERKWLVFSLFISAWLLFYLFLLSAITGLLCLVATIVFLLFRALVYGRGAFRKRLAGTGLAGIFISVVFLLLWVVKPLLLIVDPDPETLLTTTADGNLYLHDLDNQQRENGNLVYFFIAEDELEAAWVKRSSFRLDSIIQTGYPLKATLYRFLSSRGFKKDREGILSLSDREIRAIEHGIPNYLYLKWPQFLIRIHQSAWEVIEYRRTGNPSGHTFTQRLELWKASAKAFKKHPFIGWGTGSVFQAMEHGLKEIDSKLDNYRMKPHNQLLSLLLMTGIFGTIIIFVLYILFIWGTKASRLLQFNLFLVIMMVAMIGNNPLDAQLGLSFFLFFSLYFGFFQCRIMPPFLLRRKQKNNTPN